MTDATVSPSVTPAASGLMAPDARTRRRNRAEKRFRAYGLTAIVIGLLFLAVLLGAIVSKGSGAYQQTFLNVPVYLDPAKLDKKGDGNLEDIKKVSTFGYAPLIQDGLLSTVQDAGIDTPLTKSKDMKNLLSASAAAAGAGFRDRKPRPDR